MILFVNGAFGVGKTTVARVLRRRIRSSVVFDPERVGWLLQRLPDSLPLAGAGSDDFQDLRAWRRSSAGALRALRWLRPNLIVPMAFSNADYLGELRREAERRDPLVFHFCLTAPLDVIEARLRERGADPDDPRDAWSFRRARECCEAHRSALFAEQIPTEKRTPEEVAAAILARVRARALEPVS